MQLVQLDEAFERLGIVTEAAENHGILCGLLCARGDDVRDDWVTLMLGDIPGPAGASPGEAAGVQPLRAALEAPELQTVWTMLSELYRETVEELSDPGSLFSPLLPDDEESLEIRAEAVAGWCRGFVYGLGAGGIEDYSVLPDEVREVTTDIIEISHASSEIDEGGEDEAAYLELVEYLRAGVTLVFETLEADRNGSAAQRYLH